MGIPSFSVLVIVIVCLYIGLTLLLMQRKPELLWLPALAVVVCASLLYWTALPLGSEAGWFPRLVLSIGTSISLFFFLLPSLDTIVPLSQVDMTILMGLYLCAIWTTSILLMYFFSRRFSSQLWLFFHRPSGRPSHIFLGVDPYSIVLAQDIIRTDPSACILFLNFLSEDAFPTRVNIYQLFRRGARVGYDQERQLRAEVPGCVVLSAKASLRQCPGKNLFRELGLSRLERWMASPSANLYLLSDDEAETVNLISKLPLTPARVYCHTRQDRMYGRLELASERNLNLIDSSLLTSAQMKMDPDLHPVRYVKRAMNEEGEPLGWIESPFRALLLGCGGTGRGILSFLYEFSIFVGKDKQPVPRQLDVLDRRADLLAGSFRLTHPGITGKEVQFHSMEIGTQPFWEYFSSVVPSLQYITVALGDDMTNARVALDMLDLLSRGADRPVVVVKLDHPETYESLFSLYKESFGFEHIHFIGSMKSTWTVANVMEDTFADGARRYYEAYATSSGSGLSWEARNKAIFEKDTSRLWKALEYRRMVGQDYSDFMHRKTKEMLIPKRFITDLDPAKSIPTVYLGNHCEGVGSDCASVLEYLAIGEHLRWMASHQINGYRLGEQKLEDARTHPDLRDYFQLSEVVRHYDWIVVKTTLDLLRQEQGL